jgi:hypothetical protein
MRALVTAVVVLMGVILVALAPTMAQEPPAGTQPRTLFLDSKEIRTTENDLLCGGKPVYDVNATFAENGKAYLSRAVLEAHKCNTDWEYIFAGPLNVTGDATVGVKLGCGFLGVGVIQNDAIVGQLDSMSVELRKNGEVIGAGIANTDSLVCTQPRLFELTVSIPTNNATVLADDILTVRMYVKAINTEPDTLEYWYVKTGGQAGSNVTFNEIPPGGGGGTTTTPPPTTTTTTTPPVDDEAPECHRP